MCEGEGESTVTQLQPVSVIKGLNWLHYFSWRDCRCTCYTRPILSSRNFPRSFQMQMCRTDIIPSIHHWLSPFYVSSVWVNVHVFLSLQLRLGSCWRAAALLPDIVSNRSCLGFASTAAIRIYATTPPAGEQMDYITSVRYLACCCYGCGYNGTPKNMDSALRHVSLSRRFIQFFNLQKDLHELFKVYCFPLMNLLEYIKRNHLICLW